MTGPAGGSTGGSMGGATPPPEGGPIRVYNWTWGRDEDRRPQLPWLGIFLVIFGPLLLDLALPQYRSVGSLLVLAAGLASLIVWALRRSTIALYAGAFLTAASVPGLVSGLGYEAQPGLGTVAFGVAFLFVAAVRAARGGGYGWQALIGLLLLALGLPELALPQITDAVVPALLVALGLVLLTRGTFRR